MGRGGLETMLMNYYRKIDRTKVQFDFLVHREFEADYDAEIRELGGKIYHVSRLIPWSRKYQKELKNFFQEHPEYKIVHVHQDCLSSVALKCAMECGVPVRIGHSHSSSAVKNVKYLIKRYYMKKIPRYATDLLACGAMAGDWMFSGSKYQMIRNAIDTEQYEYSVEKKRQIRQEWKLEDKKVVGHVGNFTPAKNHTFLLEVFREISIKNPEANLLLVGGGEGMNAIKEKTKEMHIEDKVIFAGVRSDVQDCMQAMDVFVFPSLYEGLPVTMIEAQAAGLPCIISDRVSEECIVTDGLVTLQSLEESPNRWAEQIMEVWNQPRKTHREELQKAGYDIQTAARELEEFYIKHGDEAE